MNRVLVSLLGFMLVSSAVAQSGIPAAVLGASPLGVGPSITHQQRLLLDEKIALVDRIMRSAGAHVQGSGLSAEQQRWMLDSMYALPVAELRGMALSGSLDATTGSIKRANAKAGKPAAKFGQPDDELVYRPITPCRFIDTRNGGQGRIPGQRAFDLDETGLAYGGSAGCDPKSQVGGNANVIGAVSMNVAIINPAQFPGFLGARPFGSTNLTSMVNWYEFGPTVQASNAGIVTTNQTTIEHEIEFFGTSTHLVVDILGLFTAPTATALECVTGSLTSATPAAGANFNLVATTCPANFRMMSNSCRELGDGSNVRISGHGVVSQNNAICVGTNEGLAVATVTNTPWCCRIPGR